MRTINGMQKIRQFAKQRGAFLLAEMSIVSIITSMGVAAALIHQKEALQTERYQAQGELLKTLSASLDSYIASNYTALTNSTNATNNAAGTVVNGSIYGPAGTAATYSVTNIYAPTIAELVTAGFLSSGFSSTALVSDNNGNKANYLIKIAPSSAATCPNCDLKGLAYLDKAVKTDEIHNLGTSIAAVGANGLYSTSDTPGTLYGRSGSTNRANPVSGTPAGILAASNDYSTSGLSNFMRIDGSTKPTGNQDWNTKNLSNVGTFSTGTGSYTGTNTWTGNGVSIDSNGNIHASGTIYGTLANAASTSSLDLFTTVSSVKTNNNFVKAGAILISNGSGTVGATGTITASGTIKGGGLDATNIGITNAGNIAGAGTIDATGNFKTTAAIAVGNTTAGAAGTITTTGLIKGVGLDASGNGITNAGNITGAGTITASGLIKGTGLDATNGGIVNTGTINGATTINATGNFKTTAAIAVGTSTAGAAGTITTSGIIKGAGIDASSVGIGNAGPVTGATTVTASGLVTGSAFATSNASGGINTTGGITGTSLTIANSNSSIFNVTDLTNGVSTTLATIQNFADKVTNAVLTVLGTIKASGGDIIATMASSTSGGNIKAASELQVTQKSTQTANASNAPTTFTTTNASTAGGWFVSADDYITSLNGKGIWTSGKVNAGNGLTAGGAGIASNGAPINVYDSAGSTVMAGMSSTGAITGASLQTTGNVTSSAGYLKGGLNTATNNTCNATNIGAIAYAAAVNSTSSSVGLGGVVTCQYNPASGVYSWRDNTITMYSNTATATTVQTNKKYVRSLSNADVDCPTGYVMTGVKSTGTSGTNITQIRCSPIYQGGTLITSSW